MTKRASFLHPSSLPLQRERGALEFGSQVCCSLLQTRYDLRLRSASHMVSGLLGNRIKTLGSPYTSTPLQFSLGLSSSWLPARQTRVRLLGQGNRTDDDKCRRQHINLPISLCHPLPSSSSFCRFRISAASVDCILHSVALY